MSDLGKTSITSRPTREVPPSLERERRAAALPSRMRLVSSITRKPSRISSTTAVRATGAISSR